MIAMRSGSGGSCVKKMREEEEEGGVVEGERYITSKLVQLEDDQTVEPCDQSKRGAPFKFVRNSRVIINSSLSATLCSVTVVL